MTNIVEITSSNFEDEVLKSELPVLVDYWAEWCGPCKAVAPVVEELAREFADRLKVGKLDVDANGELAEKQGIRSIPTLRIFKGGEEVGSQVGAMSKAKLVDMVEPHI